MRVSGLLYLQNELNDPNIPHNIPIWEQGCLYSVLQGYLRQRQTAQRLRRGSKLGIKLLQRVVLARIWKGSGFNWAGHFSLADTFWVNRGKKEPRSNVEVLGGVSFLFKFTRVATSQSVLFPRPVYPKWLILHISDNMPFQHYNSWDNQTHFKKALLMLECWRGRRWRIMSANAM